MNRTMGLVAILLAVAAPAAATIRYVPGQYATIQAGVNAAQVGDTVQVAAGTYDDLFYPPVTDTTRCVVFMKSGITLRGAGAGLAIIDADSSGRGIHCEGVTNCRIEGFTVTRSFAQNYGSGIYCNQGASPVITNCTISSCYDGAIIVNYSSNPAISHCILRNNLSKQGGGLAVEFNSSPTITDCTMNRNRAPVAGGVFVRNGCTAVFERCVIDSNYLNTTNGAGGGVAVRRSNITLRNCQVNWNGSTGTGGGIDLRDQSTAVIESTYVQHDSTTAVYGPGGGIYCEESDMDLDSCTLTGNKAPGSASDGGGILIFFTNTTTITGCTIAGNSAPTTPDSLGGGISLLYASPTIERCIIAFNSPGRGMLCWDEAVPVVSCTDIYSNQDGDARCGTDGGYNFSQDPLFCDRTHDNFKLNLASPCLPGQHPGGAPCGLIGSQGAGCPTDVAEGGGPAARPVAGLYAAPNPAATQVVIHFALGQTGRVDLAVYDVSGRMVRRLASRVLVAGDHEISWDTRDEEGRLVPSGVYFYRLGGNAPTETGRLVLSR